MSDPDCIFCRIAAHQAPAFLLCEDAHGMAFMDINPVALGHCLVVSKTHAESILDIPLPDLLSVMRMVQRVARAVNAALAPEGITVLQGNGAGAAQSVPHFHTHILPRSIYDDLPMNWRLSPGNRRAIEAAAERIRAALGETA